MKITLGRQIEEIKKKDSENEKNLLKNRNSDELNELDENEDDIYFHSNAVKNIKLGSQLVNRIYLNHSIVYDLEDTIDLNLFHSLVPSATATSIIFDKLENQDISNYNLIGFCDANNHVAVYQNNTEYLVLNIRNAYIYSPQYSNSFFDDYRILSNCVFNYFNTDNVSSMSYMFGFCKALTSLDLSNFNTQNVTNMQGMFNVCGSLTSLDLSSFNTQNVTDMQYMFNVCGSLTSLDLSSFNTQNVTNMRGMFNGCGRLTSLNLSSFNTQNVTNMQYMFNVCGSLTSLDLSSFNTSKVKDMSWMFYNCRNLTSLDISNFNTDNVTNISSLFNGCSKLTSLDVSHFNTSKVTTMTEMFIGCSSLQTIISNTFSVLALTKSTNMFYNCSQLVGGNGTTYDANHIDANYARVDGENNLPGYFTAPAATNNNK